MAKGSRSRGDEITHLVRRVVAAHPDAPARTLARRVVNECKGAITVEQARQRVLRVVGQHGGPSRSQTPDKSLYRPARKAGQHAPLPASRAESWAPYHLNITGKVGVVSDIHCPYHDETALRAAIGHLKGEKIDCLLLNGDWADFYSVSRHEKNPRHRNLSRELDETKAMLRWVREQFPGIPIVAKLGNHEERWEKWLWQHAPEISDSPIMGLDHWLDFADLGIALVKDKRIIMAGHLPILHGHEKGNGISSPVNQARGAYLRLHHTVLEGHGHRTSSHSEPDMFGSETVCWSNGCLCDLRPAYAPLNKWNHGFAMVETRPGGEFDVANMRVVDGRVRSS